MYKAAPGTTETVMASAIHATKKTGTTTATAMACATNIIARPTILTGASRYEPGRQKASKRKWAQQ